MPGPFVAPARPRLPDESQVDFSDPDAVKRYIASLNAAIVQQLSQRLPQGQATAGRMYMSPDGTAWEMSVSNAGAPVLTKSPLGASGPKP